MENKKTRWSKEEKERLKTICVTEWDFEFPGYKWVANSLNSEFKNNRSASACRNMDKGLTEQYKSNNLSL